MSICNGDHKAHILISCKLPGVMSFPDQCELERNIKLAIAQVLEVKFPDLDFVLTDDEVHAGTLPDGFMS